MWVLALCLLFVSSSQAAEAFLKPEEAFRYTVQVADDAVTIRWRIAPGYYLYRDRMALRSTLPAVQVGDPRWPPGESHIDEFFGEQRIYRGDVVVVAPLTFSAERPSLLPLELKLQGCADAGLCYPPMTWSTDVGLTDVGMIRDNASSRQETTQPAAPVPEQDRLAALIRDGNMPMVLATFFGLGVLLSLTPCVLPMVPILAGIIAGAGSSVSATKGFSLAFTYVQGMALTYATAGAIFAMTVRQAPQAFFQQPWIVTSFALLFVLLALAMFGMFNLQLPGGLQTRLTSISNRQRSGTYLGVFSMGMLSALVITACVAPAIVAALAVIGQTGQVMRGAAALYASGLGMGVPLLVVGASAGSLLPKAGPWMEAVKSFFGVLFLALAIYISSALLPGALTMLLWSSLAIVTGAWLHSLCTRTGEPVSIVVRAAGLIALLYGAMLLMGVASGSRDPLRPLDRLALAAGTTPQDNHGLTFRRIKSSADLDRELAAAVAAERGVMLDFYADWCVSCKEMERYTFADASVRQALAEFVLLQADVTANDVSDRELMQRFGIFGPPAIAFFGRAGEERRSFRLVGFTRADRFREHVSSVSKDYPTG